MAVQRTPLDEPCRVAGNPGSGSSSSGPYEGFIKGLGLLGVGVHLGSVLHDELNVPEQGVVSAAHLVLEEPAALRAVELAELDARVDEALGVADERVESSFV